MVLNHTHSRKGRINIRSTLTLRSYFLSVKEAAGKNNINTTVACVLYHIKMLKNVRYLLIYVVMWRMIRLKDVEYRWYGHCDY